MTGLLVLTTGSKRPPADIHIAENVSGKRPFNVGVDRRAAALRCETHVYPHASQRHAVACPCRTNNLLGRSARGLYQKGSYEFCGGRPTLSCIEASQARHVAQCVEQGLE